MQEFDKIGEDLFNKIRGRFPSITIGSATGEVINEPSQARFFDFEYKEADKVLGNVSVNITEDEGMTIIFSKDFISNEDSQTKKNWYDFLKELRLFAKKRMLEFSIRDITKTNLTKRDYKFLSNRTGDNTMAESKLYGTSRISYQDVGSARLVIKHTESVNQELTTGRTRNVGTIYIESSEGERFKYPYKHLNGARAMAMHVAEGGNAYDDFGKYIVSLSEEQSKLSKFKRYMGRSAVMAESLAEYNDAVNERIVAVKKTLQNLQKKDYYTETLEAFAPAVMEDVPEEVAENWIDQLTIKQFNEELKDIFPYVYKLVSEVTKAKELGPDDLAEVAGPDKCWPGHRKVGTQPGTGKNKGKRVNKCKKIEGTEEALEQGFEEMMGQFSEENIEERPYIDAGINDVVVDKRGKEFKFDKDKKMFTQIGGGEEAHISTKLGQDLLKRRRNAMKRTSKMSREDTVQEAYINNAKDAIEVLGQLRGKGKQLERGQQEYKGNLPNEYVNDVWDVYTWIESKLGGSPEATDKKLKAIMDDVFRLRGEAKKMERIYKPDLKHSDEHMGAGVFANQIVNALYPLMQWIDMNEKQLEGDDNIEGQFSEDDMGDKIKAWADKYDGYIGSNGDSLPDGYVKYATSSGIPTDFIETNERAKMDEKYGEEKFEDDPGAYISDHIDEMPITKACMEELEKITGSDDIEVNAKLIMKHSDDHQEDDTMAVKIDKDGAISKDDGEAEKEQKIPLGEFILSYFDRETGEFPKGETAVLTMIEKDYGEQFIEPAKAFIERIQAKFEEYQMQAHPQQLDRMRELAGLR